MRSVVKRMQVNLAQHIDTLTYKSTYSTIYRMTLDKNYSSNYFNYFHKQMRIYKYTFSQIFI